MAVEKTTLPGNALLARYQDIKYTDCFCVVVAGEWDLPQFIEAFYTTWVFQLERFVLRFAVGRASTDAEARSLAQGGQHQFAAWDVEARAVDQILLCDLAGRTRSWLMVAPNDAGTRLYFGSAVVPKAGGDGQKRMGIVFRTLLGFHKIYSVVLLGAAMGRMVRIFK
jgi:hypothetical protein